jgi:hypothetical protein
MGLFYTEYDFGPAPSRRKTREGVGSVPALIKCSGIGNMACIKDRPAKDPAPQGRSPFAVASHGSHHSRERDSVPGQPSRAPILLRCFRENVTFWSVRDSRTFGLELRSSAVRTFTRR